MTIDTTGIPTRMTESQLKQFARCCKFIDGVSKVSINRDFGQIFVYVHHDTDLEESNIKHYLKGMIKDTNFEVEHTTSTRAFRVYRVWLP